MRPASTLAAFVFAILVLNLAMASAALAAGVANARKAFVNGDLPETVKMLEPDLFPKPRLKGKELEDARELYGVTQFMLGNRSRADVAFNQIISANPKAKLDKRFLLDPSVEPYFESLKKSRAAAQVQPQKATAADKRGTRPTRGKGRAAAAPTPPPEPPPRKQQPAPRAAPAAITGVLVKVNAPRATVFANGIFIGAANQKISLDAGVQQLSISAEGYETQEIKVRVQKGQVTTLSINLAKVGAAKPKQAQASRPKNNNSQSRSAQRQSAEQPRASLDFNQPLPGEKKANKARKNFTDQYFQEPAPQYAQPQPQQQYSQPPPQYAPPPQYQVPQSPPYPAPQYSYPPPVYAPPPVYQAPQPYGYPDPYAQVPAYTPPPPAYGAPDPYEEEEEAGDVVRSDSRPARTSKTRRRKDSGGSAFLALLPFGIGQFQNSQNIKGTIFLLAEGGALGFGLTYRLYNIPKDKKLFDLQRAEETDLSETEKEDIELKREAHLKKLTDYSNYALIAAGGLYAIGVIDAFIYLESGSGSGKRRRSEYRLISPEEQRYKVALGTTAEGGIALGLRIRLD
jgi:hypothetical protein